MIVLDHTSINDLTTFSGLPEPVTLLALTPMFTSNTVDWL